jgi:hypothetical protein
MHRILFPVAYDLVNLKPCILLYIFLMMLECLSWEKASSGNRLTHEWILVSYLLETGYLGHLGTHTHL